MKACGENTCDGVFLEQKPGTGVNFTQPLLVTPTGTHCTGCTLVHLCFKLDEKLARVHFMPPIDEVSENAAWVLRTDVMV